MTVSGARLSCISPGRAGRGHARGPPRPRGWPLGSRTRTGLGGCGRQAISAASFKGVSPQLALARLGGNSPEFQAFANGTASGTAWGLSTLPPPQSPLPLTQPVRSAACESHRQEVCRGAESFKEGKNGALVSTSNKLSPNPESEGLLLCRSACVSGFPGAWLGLEIEMHSVHSFT